MHASDRSAVADSAPNKNQVPGVMPSIQEPISVGPAATCEHSTSALCARCTAKLCMLLMLATKFSEGEQQKDLGAMKFKPLRGQRKCEEVAADYEPLVIAAALRAHLRVQAPCLTACKPWPSRSAQGLAAPGSGCAAGQALARAGRQASSPALSTARFQRRHVWARARRSAGLDSLVKTRLQSRSLLISSSSDDVAVCMVDAAPWEAAPPSHDLTTSLPKHACILAACWLTSSA